MFTQNGYFKKLTIKKNSKINNKVLNVAINKEYKVFFLKFILSLILILGGIFLIYVGIQSDSIIEFTFGDLNLKLNKALPGTTLAIFGVVLMLFSRINIKIK